MNFTRPLNSDFQLFSAGSNFIKDNTSKVESTNRYYNLKIKKNEKYT